MDTQWLRMRTERPTIEYVVWMHVVLRLVVRSVCKYEEETVSRVIGVGRSRGSTTTATTTTTTTATTTPRHTLASGARRLARAT